MAKITPFTEVSHGYIVVVVLIPIISLFAIFELANIFSNYEVSQDNEAFHNIYSWGWWFLIIVLINGLLCDLDSRKLEESNIKLNKSFFWGAILVPVYLYMRGSALNKIYRLGWLKAQIAFIAWFICFFLQFPIESWLLGENRKDLINLTQNSKFPEISNKNNLTFDPCHFPISLKEVRSKNLDNYIDKTGQILVHLNQGARSSDLKIFNLNSGTYTNINSSYKENNENRKLTKKDIELFNSFQEQDAYQSICVFKDELIVSDMFSCKIKDSNIICNWLYM